MQDSSKHNDKSKQKQSQIFDQEMVEAFTSLFKGRTDCWGKLSTPSGLCIYETVTLEHYRRHLKGETSLGVYFNLDDSTCHFAAIDIDDFSFNKAKAVRAALRAIGIPSYIASSKRNHFHVYLFAEDRFVSKEIRRILIHVRDELGIKTDKGQTLEVFPKQDYHQPDSPPSEKYPEGEKHPGSYINLPCFGYTRPFLAVDDNGAPQEVPLEVALEQIKRAPNEVIKGILKTIPEESPKKETKRPKQEYKERGREFNKLAVDKLSENCAFMRHCQDEADSLSEPHWWSMCDILSFFGEPGRQKAHELSQPYPKYTEEETNKKLEYAKEAKDKDIGPHTCGHIEKDLGFNCPADCKAKLWHLKSPVVLANRLASEGLHITIDGTTYLERLDVNRIISRTRQAKEDAPPVIKTLASFLIEPKMRITLEGESERLDTVLKTGEAEYPCLLKREAFNSKRQFLAALPNVDLQYYATDKDTQAILAMVTSEELPIRKGATVLGRHGDLWVVKDGVLSKDGWIDSPELVYIPSEVEFDRRVCYPTPEDEPALIKQITPLLLMLNQGKIILPVLGWFFSTPFVPEIRRRLRHFPLLVVWGTHGGGKSSLLSLLWQLFGVKSELFSSTETAFTFLRLFSGTSTVPVIIDEFKPFNMKEDETRLLIRFLKRLYDGEIEHRGRPDLSLVAYHLQAPTAIAGEVTPIALESAMVERVIQVNLNPDTLNTPSYVRAFNELATLTLGGFALPYIRWCLGANLDGLMTEARALLPAILREVPPRVKDNALVMTTGLVALKQFAARYGVEIAQDAFRTGINESIEELIAELFERGAHEEIGLTIFLETLATLAQTGRIKHGVHYTTDDINTRLYIHLPDCVAEFRKFVRETNARVEVLDERAYRRQAREVCQRKSYVLETNTNKWFKMYQTEKGEMGKIRKCIEIDLEQLPFDTSGFEEPVGD